ncbi:GTP-binding protein [Calycomorphotria hydatis]|uniref:Metal chaperone YciC n=1 Tax=Calycomorphotria hydatis TaxID=2528027 RepID=A0A517TC15_9PLAN|nr:GTP-binding protein [Calycomorphotria hydatis]QDT65900.1 Putative metal chaperone YciC [Calycomorphotria hydatis]
MNKPIRFIMVGGFLGAGKTTTVSRLAAHYQSQGLNVGVVTNDQATDLVDSNLLRSQGFEVGEVAGACFCCNFDELMSTADRLSFAERPDVILAEPVGSCTDLVATVLQPIKQLYDAEFEIAPYAVIVKPSHGLRILKGDTGTGFSPKAAYILKKQLEEADAILVNRIDELSEEEVAELTQLVRKHHPDTTLLPISAKEGTGFEAFVELLDQQGDFARKILDIDYDIYAEGEAELGWLNASVNLTGTEPFALDDLLMRVIEQLRSQLRAAGHEPAHLKTIGLWEGFFGVANLISSDTPPQLSLPSNSEVTTADVIVNARVACDPEFLEQSVRSTLSDIAKDFDLDVEWRQVQSFRPGRPVPTHRMDVAT